MSEPTGNIFIISAPSGAGKSSLVNALLKNDPRCVLSVSCTTRPPRSGEENGVHYRFVTVDDFEQMRNDGMLLEWAHVHGNYYGTPRDRIDQALSDGRDVILEIDWQGAQQIRRHFPRAVGVFILPPSLQALQARLQARGQDAADVIARRLQAAGNEMSHAPEFQYVIINQEFSVASQQLSDIVAASRLRYASQAALHATLFNQLGAAPPSA